MSGRDTDSLPRRLPGSSAHGIFQTRIFQWVGISYSRESSQTRDRPVSPASPTLAGRFFATENLQFEVHKTDLNIKPGAT